MALRSQHCLTGGNREEHHYLRSERVTSMLRPMTMRLLVALLCPLLLTACGADFQSDTSSPRAAGTPLTVGGQRVEPGQSVVLHQCGVVNISYGGQEWEVENDPFDETNAPGTFSGYGTFERSGDTLVFKDDEGATLRFTAWDGRPDPLNCG